MITTEEYTKWKSSNKILLPGTPSMRCIFFNNSKTVPLAIVTSQGKENILHSIQNGEKIFYDLGAIIRKTVPIATEINAARNNCLINRFLFITLFFIFRGKDTN